MSIRMKKCRVWLAVVVLLLGGGKVSTVFGQEVRIVVPKAMENNEGNTLGQYPAGDDFRYQGLFLASEFNSLPETHRTIIGYSFRPDKSVTETHTVTYADLQIRLSNTSKTPDDLEIVFDNNLGDDVTTVYDGPWTGTTQATGPPGGPRDFDYGPSYFTTPFFYDPTSGRNLLWEIVSFSGSSAILYEDEYTTSSPMAVLGGAADSSGELINAGFVMQFIFVPEPSTLFMAALVLVGFAVFGLRK